MVARGLALEPAPGVVVSIALHLAAFAMLARCQPTMAPLPECGNAIIEGREVCDDGNTKDGDGCSSQCTLELELRNVELEQPKPPEPPPPAPEPEIEAPAPEPPPPEPPPPPKAEPKPKPTPKPKAPPPSEPPPAAAPPAPPAIELPLDTTLGSSNSGVTVIGGSQSRAGEKGGQKGGQAGGVPGGTGTTVGGRGNAPAGPASGGSGRTWSPQNDLYIGQGPVPVRVDQIQCPAAASLGLTGVVVLKVRIWRDGEVGRVQVVKGIGQGCDEVAVKALKRAKFKPARGTDGQPYDYEITYEYEFANR